MARAARYGNIQPSEFLAMDWDEGSELARRVTIMHYEEKKEEAEFQFEQTKAIIKALGARVI